MSGVDLLRGKGTFRDAAVYRQHQKPATDYGNVGERVDGRQVGPTVSLNVMVVRGRSPSFFFLVDPRTFTTFP